MDLVASLLCVVILGAAPAGKIAFVSGTEQEDHCVTVLDIASGRQTRVGTGNRDGAPVWSPDGAWIAFTSSVDGGCRVRLARADGSEPRAVPHAAEWNRWPRWSPDGAKIAYAAGDVFAAKIVVYDLASNAEVEWGGGRSGLLRPVWLNASSIIAIMVTGDPGRYSTDMAEVTPKSVNPFPEAYYPSKGTYAEWAVETTAKGLPLAFESNDGGDREIFVLSERRGAFDVSNHRAADWNPVWSPDGKWLAFESFRGGRRGVYRVFPDTARVFPVAESQDADNWSSAWSPDRRYMAFVSDRTGNPELFVQDLEGKDGPVQVTHHPGDDFAPAWQPKGKP